MFKRILKSILYKSRLHVIQNAYDKVNQIKRVHADLFYQTRPEYANHKQFGHVGWSFCVN